MQLVRYDSEPYVETEQRSFGYQGPTPRDRNRDDLGNARYRQERRLAEKSNASLGRWGSAVLFLLPGRMQWCRWSSVVTASICPNCGSPVELHHRFCPSCGHRLDSTPIVDQRRLITALFIDLVGSTSLAEELDPELLRLVLSRYFDAVASAISEFGGSVSKYIGDAVVGVFGLSRSLGDDASRALRAALLAHKNLSDLNRSLEEDYGIRLAIRCGVATGEVVASQVEEVVLGDVMNTAARLQQSAGEGSTLVESRTVDLAGNSFELKEVGPVDVRGKSLPVAVFELHGETPSGTRNRKVALVGRREESQILSGWLEDVRRRERPQSVVVVGEAGVGKSTLVGAFSAEAIRTGFESVVVACQSHGQGFASWPLRQLLNELTGSDLTSNTELGTEALAVLASRTTEPHVTTDALAISAGVDAPGNSLRRLPLEAVHREIVRAWVEVLTQRADGSPLLLVIEDLHWVDLEFVGLLQEIVSRASGSILLVGTTRPDSAVTDVLINEASWESLHLAALSEEEASMLTQRLLPGLEREVARTLLKPAQGNPFYMEEIVGHLSQTGALSRSGEGFELGATGDVGVPDSIRALIGARIDGLRTEAKAAVLAGSVLGQIVHADALARVLGVNRVDSHLQQMTEAGLIVASKERELGPAWEFRHDLLREVAYASLPKGKAAEYHIAAAEWLEDVAGSEGPFSDVIANHLATAAEARKLAWPDDKAQAEAVRNRAVRQLKATSDTLLSRSQWGEALRLVERASHLAHPGPETHELSLAKARIYRAADRFNEAFDAYRELIETCRKDASEQVRSDALIEGVVMVAQMGGGIDDSKNWKSWLLDVTKTELARAEKNHSQEEVAALRMARGSLHFWRIGEVTAEEAHDAAKEAFEVASDIESMRVKAPAMDLLAGFTLFGMGLGPALELTDQLLAVADDAPNRVIANELYTTAQWLLVASGDLDRAEEVGSRHLVEAELLGTHTRIHAHRGQVELALARGDLGEAEAATEDLLKLIAADGGKVCDHGGVAVTGRALALSERGAEEGIELFRRFEELANPSAMFAAHYGNLERWWPFIEHDEALERLEQLGPPQTAYQETARCWVTVPLAASMQDQASLRSDLAEVERLAEVTSDPALPILSEWGRGVQDLISGSSVAESVVRSSVDRLIKLGRTYTGWRLAATAAPLLRESRTWLRELADDAETGHALQVAETLRSSHRFPTDRQKD